MDRLSFQPIRDTVSVDIASAASKSPAVSCGGLSPLGIVLPATVTGTNVLFEGSVDGATFYPVRLDSGADYLFAVSGSVSKATMFSAAMQAALSVFTHIKVVTGTSHASLTTQGQLTTFQILFGKR